VCEFCLKHGEGETWYLRAENYSEDLLSEVRGRGLIEDFFTGSERIREGVGRLEQLDTAPRGRRSQARDS